MSKELHAKWTRELNWHLDNPEKRKGQAKITATSPLHQEWLERAFQNLKKKYDLWWEAPTLWIWYSPLSSGE